MFYFKFLMKQFAYYHTKGHSRINKYILVLLREDNERISISLYMGS